MARRSPTNERYQKDTAPSGKTRRSAASAKPKRSTEGDAPAPKKSSSKAPPRRPAVSIHPPTAEYRKIRRVWWVFMGAAVLLSTVSWWLWRQPMDRNYGTVVLVLAYASIGVAIWLDWTKMRPLRQEWAKEQAKGKKS